MLDLKKQLRLLGWQLPQSNISIATYVPVVQVGDLLIISGQLPILEGKLLACGAVTEKVSVEEASRAAGQCVVNAITAIGSYLQDDWDRLVRIVRVCVFVQSTSDFCGQSQVANGASELLVTLLGENGRHARTAIGVNALPMDAAVEVELMVQIRG